MQSKSRRLAISLPVLMFCLAGAEAQDPNIPQTSPPPQSNPQTGQKSEKDRLDSPLDQPAQKATTQFEIGQILMPGHPLLVMMTERQLAAQRMYKSVSFDQKAVVERYKPRKEVEDSEEITQHREIVAHYEPDGSGELKVSLVSDSDRKAFEKYQKEQQKQQEADRKQEEEQRKSLAQKLISPLLFPMTTENVQRCKFTVLLSLPDLVLLRFEPEVMRTRDPIFSGQAFVDPRTGDIYRLSIDNLYNFERIDGKFKHLKEFEVAITYTPQFGGHRFPTHLVGRGYAKVFWVKGYFQFQVAETGYSHGELLAKQLEAEGMSTTDPSSPAQAAPISWETVQSWSGAGARKTEILEVERRQWRVEWKATGDGVFQIFAYSAEGNLIDLLARNQGDGTGISPAYETPPDSLYLVINSLNTDWAIDFQASKASPEASKPVQSGPR